MRNHWELTLYLFLLMVGALACSTQETPEPLPTIVADETCQGMMNYSFVSAATFELGEGEQGPIFGPHIVSFLNDGRVFWRYSLSYYVGTFQCDKGVFTATFTEGEKKYFEGTYVAQTDTVQIEQVSYFKAANQ